MEPLEGFPLRGSPVRGILENVPSSVHWGSRGVGPLLCWRGSSEGGSLEGVPWGVTWRRSTGEVAWRVSLKGVPFCPL